MPSTPNFDLPYPGSGDAPCEFGQQWCEFTESVEGVLDGFQTTLDRTVPIIPVALLQAPESQVITSGTFVSFDTVLIDTARMTDMDLNPFGITITRAGRYTLTGGMIVPPESLPFPPNFVGIAIIEPGLNFSTFDYSYSNPENIIYMNVGVPVVSLNVGEQVALMLIRGSVADYTVQTAWLGVAWHSDTEVP